MLDLFQYYNGFIQWIQTCLKAARVSIIGVVTAAGSALVRSVAVGDRLYLIFPPESSSVVKCFSEWNHKGSGVRMRDDSLIQRKFALL